MKPIVHWLRFDQKTSGLYTYTYSLHRASLELGYDSHICYSDEDLQGGGTINLPNPTIGKVQFSPWSVRKDAINFTHDSMPQMKLDNWITEMHGHPVYAAQNMDPLSTTMYKLERVKLVFTRFPSHVQYWQQATKAPIHYIPPGVDLSFFKPQGKKIEYLRPILLWADTVRPPVKSPTDLIYAMKILTGAMPSLGLKLVALPLEELAGYAYLCGALRLDSAIEWPLEPMFKDMDQLYRGATIMYSDTNEEGSNSSWEAEACGLQVIHRKPSPQEIADAVISALTTGIVDSLPKRRDIKDTAKAMMAHLEAQQWTITQ